MTRRKRMPLFDDLSTALCSIKKIKNVTCDDERKTPSSGGNHLHHRHSKSSDILPQLQLLEETSNPAVFHDSDMAIIDAEMKASITSDIELFPRKRKKSNPSQYLSMRSQSVRNRYASELSQTLSVPNHKNKNEIPSSRSGESWSEDNLLNTKPSNLSSLHIPMDRDDQRNTKDIPFDLSDLPCDSHTKHQSLEIRLQLQSQRNSLEPGISQILRPESGQNKYSKDYLIKKPYYEHSFVDNFETFGFPKAHIVKGFKIMPNNNRKMSGVPIEMNDYHSSKNRSNHYPSNSFTTTIQTFLTDPDDTNLEADDKITERVRAQVNETFRTTYQRTRTIDQALINVSNIMVPPIRCSEGDRSINIIVRAVKSCDESISDSSELETDLSISTTRIPYCTSRTTFYHLDEKIDTKIPVVDEYFVSKSKINLHCQRTRGFRTASNKFLSLFTVSNNIIHGSTSTLDQRSVTVANKPKSVIQKFLHNQFFTTLHGMNIKQRILSKIGSHQNLSAGNDNMSNIISQIDDQNESSFNLTRVNDETSRFSTEETSNNSYNFLRESQSTSLITELRDLIEKFSKNNRNPMANLSSDEYIVAYYEDGPRVFRLEQIYSIGNLESIKTDPVIDFYAYGTDDSFLSKNCGNVLANQVFDQDILNKVDSEVSAHYDGKNFSCVDPRPLRYNQLSRNHDYIVNIDGFSSESHENEIRCPKCAYFARQSCSRYPLSPPSKEWELMYTQSELDELKVRGDKAAVRLNENRNRGYPLPDNKFHLATQNRDQKSTNFHGKTHRLETCTHSYSYNGNRSTPKAKRISLVLLFSCFLFSPILFPVYFLGGFDFLMSFLTNGKILQCNQIQKRWALWACIPSWIIAMFLICVIIWWTYL
ncbi:hypothetical protein GcC1_037009 [Golovinomyces cichoracearum]|uniref:Uncharacterized protein n=1 Tax=Golovinomyces cichoracearum TaxID=62708 RepID=A0A420J0G8_9PEZI|nr:hypothetical protein GcC1_037009 [Golovinomyces cichoracearum]